MASPLRSGGTPFAQRRSVATPLTVVPGRRRMAWFAVGLTMLVGLVLTGALLLHTRLAERQLQIDSLERSVREERQQFDVLRAQRAELRSPARLADAASVLGMGDVGALGIGSALAFLALTLNTHLLLALICGINVMEAGSVAIQMGVFKASGRKRRLFRMSPIHHHFELAGWPETTVIIRFWLLSAVSVASALAIFIGDFTRVTGGLNG